MLAVGAALVPVLFAFGGWQQTNFMAEEIDRARAQPAPGAAGGSEHRGRGVPPGEPGLSQDPGSRRTRLRAARRPPTR